MPHFATDNPPMPERFLSMLHSLPAPADADALAAALDGVSPVAIRLNNRKCRDVPYNPATHVEWCDDGYYLPERPNFTLNPLLHAGAFYVQEAASMIYQTIAHTLAGDSRVPLKVLDLCAAPGGKTTALINALPDGSAVIANEFSPQRANILKENLIKNGFPGVAVTCGDAARFSEMEEVFDLVVADVPCSGEGMMRKEPAARTQWNEGLIRSCAEMQRPILESAVRALRPGGTLIFSTCTFNTTENEGNLRRLIDGGMEPVPVDISRWNGLCHGFAEIAGEEGAACSIRFFPDKVASEGLFVAVLRKPGQPEEENYPAPGRTQRGNRDRKDLRNKKDEAAILKQVAGWLGDTSGFDLEIQKDRVVATPVRLAALLRGIPQGIKILSAGITLGNIKGRDIIPSHQLALSTELNPASFPIVKLSEEEALRYLRRDAVTLPDATPKRFVIVAFAGFPLGFVKNIGNRANNLYPQEYRIRQR